MKTMILLLTFVFGCHLAQAQGVLVERVIEVQTNEKNPATARTLLMNQASDKASEDLIKEIIGESKYSRNRALITNRILKKSASYLPFSKAGELKSLPEGFQMVVTVKANLDELQKVLLENGLFYEADSTPSLLPVVRWVDRVNSKTFAWWMGTSDTSKGFLSKESRSFETALSESFLKSGFYLIRPQTLGYEDQLAPQDRAESVSQDRQSQWAQVWNASLLLTGQILMTKGDRGDAVAVDVRLTALQSANGRVVAEVARRFETDSGAFEAVLDRKLKEMLPVISNDLAAQVLEAWKQGAINSQLYRVKILGRLSLPGQEAFKEALRSRAREIKSVRERMIEANQMVFEMDSSSHPTEIAKKLGVLEVNGQKLIVDSANEKELVLKLGR